MRSIYRRAYRVVAVSQQLACDLVKELNLPAEKVVAIPNPLALEEIREAAVASVSHRFFSEGVPVLMAAGRLHPRKDFPTLVRAVADLRKRRDVRLIVLGEGPERSKLEMLVQSLGLSDVVDLPGFVSPPWPWMARADVFALSSWGEGWPGVLGEALALGIPVVATDCPTGPREILDNGRFGPLVPVGDVSAMSVALEAMLDDPPDRAILRGRADEWSSERVVESYLSILQAE
jgi:glycosyltransferase involved in cell wall biosynthesis